MRCHGAVVVLSLVFCSSWALAADKPASVRFEPNRGQADPRWSFLAHTADGPLLLGEQEARVGGAGLAFPGADPDAAWAPIDLLPGRAHYLLGNDPAGWLLDIPTFGALVRRSMYPGIDLTLRGSGRRLQLEFLVAPDADSGDIALEVEGPLRLASPRVNGEPASFVVAGNGLGVATPRRTRAGALRVEVAIDLLDPTVAPEPPLLTADSAGNLLLVGRVAGDRATAFVSVLDPSSREVSSTTYLDALDPASPLAVAAAKSGDVVVVGAEAGDAVAVRIDRSGRKIVHRTTIGGTGADAALAVAVDAEGNAWLAGRTTSLDLPLTSPTIQGSPGGDVDAFVAKLDPSGAVVLSSYLGAATAEEARGIALDREGAVYLTGTLGADALVAKLDPEALSLVFALPFGGTGEDEGAAIAVTESGEILLTGTTRSPDLPVVGGGRTVIDGGSDAFLARLDPGGHGILFSTHLGGPLDERARALTLDRHGRAWVVGSRGADAFAVQVSLDKASVARDVTLVGELEDVASGVVVDANGDALVAGLTASASLPDAERPAATRGGDVFLARVEGGEPTPRGVCPGSKNFLGIEDNLWENPDNWSGASLPTASDDVCIQGFSVVMGGGFQNAGTLRVEGGSLTIAGAQLTVGGTSEITGSLNFQSGTLTGAGNITISGPFSWTGGTLSGSGITTTIGSVSLSGPAAKGVFAHRWDANSNVTWTQGQVSVASGAVINNAATWDCQSDAPIVWTVGTATAFNNSGTFKKSAGTGTTVQMPFYNTGSVVIQSGLMNFNSGGASTGSFSVPAGTTLEFLGGGFDFNAGTTLTGAGRVLLDIATLNVNAAVTIPAGMTFDMAGGILASTGTLTAAGPFNWTGGTMQHGGVTTCNGPLNISGTAARGIQLGRTLNVNATANFTATGTGNLGVSTAAVINNVGTWDFQGDGSIIWGVGTAPVFNNTGTLKKSAGAGTSFVQLPFVNTGVVLVQSGTINSNQGGSSTGNFDIAAGRTMQFGGGTFAIDAGTTFTGAGNVLLSAATLSVNTSIGIPATIPFDMTGGILTGLGTLTTAGPLNWTGGTMQSTGVTTCNGPLNISGTAARGMQLGRTLNVNATANFTATGGGNLGVSTAAVINNVGTWDFQGDGSIVWGVGTAPVFNNTGTLKKSAGTGTSFVQLPFVNDGVVLVQTGTLNSNQGGSSTGPFDIAGGTTLQWGGGTFNLNAGTTFTGLGGILLSAAALNVNAAIGTPPTITFDMTGGTINGLGTLTTAGPFNWSAGTMNSAGTTNFDGPLNISGAGAKGVSTRILNNNLLATWTGTATFGMSFAAVVNNNGTWECLNDASIVWGVGSAPVFSNFGTFRKTLGVGTTTLQLPYRNAGTVDIRSGLISTNNYIQTAGTTQLTGGAFSSTATIGIQGGTLAGSGTVTGNVLVSNTGALAPGLSAGALNITGTYTQQAPSTGFNVEIGGLTPGTQHDRANVTGTTTLAGNLNVTLINGYVPLPGDSFTILTYPSRTGTFTLNLPSSGCIGWRISYGATALVLTAEAVPQEITSLTMPSKTTLSWAAAAAYANTSYNVLRGALDTLPVGPGADETCVVPSTTGTTGSDTATPLAGKGFWYLVRETVVGCGAGTYGFATSGAERLSTACP